MSQACCLSGHILIRDMPALCCPDTCLCCSYGEHTALCNYAIKQVLAFQKKILLLYADIKAITLL